MPRRRVRLTEDLLEGVSSSRRTGGRIAVAEIIDVVDVEVPGEVLGLGEELGARGAWLLKVYGSLNRVINHILYPRRKDYAIKQTLSAITANLRNGCVCHQVLAN